MKPIESERFSQISVLDSRYPDEENIEYFSELARIRGQLEFESVLALAGAEAGFIPLSAADDIAQACSWVAPAEVYIEETEVTKHDIRALVNCITRYLKDKNNARYIHLGVTSYDGINSSEARKYQRALRNVLIFHLRDFERVLVGKTIEYANTPQIGRTHGIHAVPITFGFALALFVERLGDCILAIEDRTGKLRGKVSGATGSADGLVLITADPIKYEQQVLKRLGLLPAPISSQIVPPEPMARVLFEVIVACGVEANLARDMRNLQRTEIDEVREKTSEKQVGSSTMPHKLGNPINFENVESMFKIVMPRIITVLMDLISEHQRDLTNSASSRTYTEIVAYAVLMTKRLKRTMQNLVVRTEQMERNITLTGDLMLAEPMYILLAQHGCPDAHEKVRQIAVTLAALPKETRPSLLDAVSQDAYLEPLLNQFTEQERLIVTHPKYYSGLASKKATDTARRWNDILELGVEIPERQ